MPIKGQVVVNPTTGDCYEFLETAKDTHGLRVTMKATIAHRGQLVPRHFHVLQDETFEVLDGELTVWLNGESSVVKAGEKIHLPKGVPHNHYNAGERPLCYLHIVSPGLDFDYLIENLVGLAADGKRKNGNYGLLQQLVSLKYLDSKSYLADIPVGLQKLMMQVGAPLGRLLGYRAIYRKYSGFEK